MPAKTKKQKRTACAIKHGAKLSGVRMSKKTAAEFCKGRPRK